jgi:hypothetical protein
MVRVMSGHIVAEATDRGSNRISVRARSGKIRYECRQACPGP